MPALSKIPPATPQICHALGTKNSIKLAWNACEVLSGEEMPYYFGIYRFVGELVGDFKDPRNLLAMTPYDNEKWIFEDLTALTDEHYTYVILAYNRLNVASYSSEPLYVKKTRVGARVKRRH